MTIIFYARDDVRRGVRYQKYRAYTMHNQLFELYICIYICIHLMLIPHYKQLYSRIPLKFCCLSISPSQSAKTSGFSQSYV